MKFATLMVAVLLTGYAAPLLWADDSDNSQDQAVTQKGTDNGNANNASPPRKGSNEFSAPDKSPFSTGTNAVGSSVPKDQMNTSYGLLQNGVGSSLAVKPATGAQLSGPSALPKTTAGQGTVLQTHSTIGSATGGAGSGKTAGNNLGTKEKMGTHFKKAVTGGKSALRPNAPSSLQSLKPPSGTGPVTGSGVVPGQALQRPGFSGAGAVNSTAPH